MRKALENDINTPLVLTKFIEQHNNTSGADPIRVNSPKEGFKFRGSAVLLVLGPQNIAATLYGDTILWHLCL